MIVKRIQMLGDTLSRWRRAGLLAVLMSAAACAPAADGPTLRIAYVDWSSSVASANVVCAVLRERLGHPCELIQTTADAMWRMVADGEADALLSAWLPDTHADYYAKYGDQLTDLGPNLVGTRTGLVIPAVGVGRQTGGRGERTQPALDIDSIAQLAEHRQALGGRIVGIDPAAGIMSATERALDAYDLEGFRLVKGSEAAMTQSLADAIARNTPIVVTGWEPHWMLGRWSLKFLDDPKNVYGGRGSIHTLVRPGLAVDDPKAQGVLDRFAWGSRDMEQLLVWIHQDGGRDPYAQALRWTQANPRRVQAWIGTNGAD
ncbi:ABC-type glycine betaine transport, periplasmic subunit [Thiorhodococcus drewsii AZ1]|uniref:ABC-type glycine betaine transport, periplasmic subunit n=1 Tax=Thiorhodococcus drewsii AZ1 TaxID=765913 RepID=G2E2B0_9GAMM|nr:glycine betaine ABC transporter substrate-binding protein [Thiorhodococcus drewsii]EGV30826.1 ABC-type glycine betaine transport, periplasmic subunit [Thiorhodococcus drewsii AZ1]